LSFNSKYSLLIKPGLVNKKTGHVEVLHRKVAEYQTMAAERLTRLWEPISIASKR
jgi:hypothetical protein